MAAGGYQDFVVTHMCIAGDQEDLGDTIECLYCRAGERRYIALTFGNRAGATENAAEVGDYLEWCVVRDVLADLILDRD